MRRHLPLARAPCVACWSRSQCRRAPRRRRTACRAQRPPLTARPVRRRERREESMSATTTLDRPVTEIFWSERFAGRTRGMTSSSIRELLKLTEQPEIISFAGGLPAPELFPLPEIRAAVQRALDEHGAQALQYGATEGYLPLREMLVRHMDRYGVRVTPANVLVTSGAQQALDLVGKLLLDPGDKVITEQPTFLGALQAFTAYEARYLPVPIDADGMQVDRLEDLLEAGAKFIYVLPNFQNPGGVTLSLERRIRLVELASRHGVPIVEDDPYG